MTNLKIYLSRKVFIEINTSDTPATTVALRCLDNEIESFFFSKIPQEISDAMKQDGILLYDWIKNV